MTDQAGKIKVLGVGVDAYDVPTLHLELAHLIVNDEHSLVLNVNAYCWTWHMKTNGFASS